MNTFRDVLRKGTRCLRDAGIENYEREAEWLLELVTGCARADFYVKPGDPVLSEQFRHYTQLLAQRSAHVPLQYVMASVEFFGRSFDVGPGALIPRPETERLVEIAVSHYPGYGLACDVCTGTGVIGLTLCLELPVIPLLLAIDISEKALSYCMRNRTQLNAAAASICQADLLTATSPAPMFSLITANPPYVDSEAYKDLPTEIKDHEPPIALRAGKGGVEVITRLSAQAHRRLTPNGWFITEIGEDQAGAVHRQLTCLGFSNVSIVDDYTGRPRIALGCKHA
ncbi:MAG: peptide chain release factor N(5)-glutamine methyltransferase [Candidatus Pacebacteria bacterium]|nr:peptide chain release factor N(5)-glutamine methyltransferase [Candidatus Paceibacterota bacterium]